MEYQFLLTSSFLYFLHPSHDMIINGLRTICGHYELILPQQRLAADILDIMDHISYGILPDPFYAKLMEHLKILPEIHDIIAKQHQIEEETVPLPESLLIILTLDQITDTIVSLHESRLLLHLCIQGLVHDTRTLISAGLALSVIDAVLPQKHLPHTAAQSRHLVPGKDSVLCNNETEL